MGAGSRSVRAALAIACIVAVCPRGADAEGQEGPPRPPIAAAPVPPATGSRTAPTELSARLPLQFEKTSGERGRASFVARGPGYDLTLTPGEAALTLRKPGQPPTGTLRMVLAGGAATPDIAGLDALPGKVYHATSASHGTLTGNPAFRRVKAAGVYPGIDLVYYGNQRHLEFDFLVAPRRDPKQIRLAFSGADRVRLEPGGELSLRVDGEDVRLKAPVIYQERGDIREPVAGGYRILDAAKHHVGFQVGDYDRSRPLVIDPTIVFATYQGGADFERPTQIAVNAIGEVYLFADSGDPSSLPRYSSAQIVPLASPQPGFAQCFLTKLSRDGTTALYTLIFEGAGCQAMTLAPDERSDTRKIHLQVGTSYHYQRTLTESPTDGLTLAPLQGAYDVCLTGQGCGPVQWMRADSNGDVYFVMSYTPSGMTAPDFVYELRKIDTQGQLAGAIRLIQPPIYASPSGNYVHDQITGLELDHRGSAYVIGYGASPDVFTPTENALMLTKPSGDVCPDPMSGTCYDGFVLKIDTTGPQFDIAYASYLGGMYDDRPFGLAWDAVSASLFVTGTTRSWNFPFTPGSSSPFPPQGGQSGFLIKLDPDALPAQQIRFGTFLGYSSPLAVAVLPGGMPAVVGQATDYHLDACGIHCFPLVGSLYPARIQYESRPFLSVFSADGATLPFSTFLDATGGSNSFITTVAVNGSSTVYAAMLTDDGALGSVGALQPSNNGGYDALVQAIDVSGITPANGPPEIAFTPAFVTVAATDPLANTIVPLICGRLFACAVADPEGEFLTHVTWYGPNGFRATNPGALPAPAGPGVVPRAYAALPPGTHTFTLVARDESGAIGTGTLTVNVAGVNTNPGALQTVVLTDRKFVVNEAGQLGSERPVSVTFETVTAPGLTWLESRWDLLPRPPAGLQAGSPPYYYGIQSNATFTGTVRVCLNIRGMSLARGQAALQLHRLVAGVWTPLTNQAAPSSDEICADAPGLGTFAIFYPQVPETAIAAIAGTGFAEDSIDPPGGDPRDEFNYNPGPALQSTLTRPDRLALLPIGNSRNVLVADNGYPYGSRLRILNLRTGEIGNFLEARECYGFGPLTADLAGQFFYCTKPDGDTGLVDILQFDMETGVRRHVASAPEVLAMVTDAGGNLFYSDGNIHRVPVTGGASERIFAFNGTQGGLNLPYFDRAWTLAFDSEGHLLGGGMTLIRISPGADGLVNGSPDEAVATIGGIPGANLIGYPEPFSGDGLPASQAMLAFTYQMVVASDGAVVFTDRSDRIRRIAPGADGVVNGGPDEIVRTIAGYFGFGEPGSGFATAEYAHFRGLVEDPDAPGSFIVSSHSGHALLRFGIAPDGEQPPPPPPTAVIDVTETIVVDDGIVVMPSAMVAITETIVVDDGLTVLGSAIIELTETIVVDDGIVVLPSAMIQLTETILVDDGIGVLPSAMIALTEAIVVDDGVAVVPGTPPVLSLPANLTAEAVGPAGAVVTFLATAIDDVDGPVAVSCEPASGEAFALGATLVTCSASDAAGSVGRGTFTVTVVDTTPPVLTLPANIVTSASSTAGVPVNYLASATDLVAGPLAIDCSPASGSTFGIGVTTVTCTATDPAGNPRTGSFTVTVTQTPLPVLQLAGLPVLTQDASGRYVGSITVRNPMPLPATAVQVTTAILNSTPAASLPVQLGTIAPGALVTTAVTFAGSAGAPGSAGTLRLTFSWTGKSVSISQRVTLPSTTAPLWGWVDLHTHPMSNLAFGGKLFHGAPDIGSLMPAVQMPSDPQCRFDDRATSMNEALSDDAPTHGDPLQSKCGDFARKTIVQALEAFNGAIVQPGHAVGSPSFVNWPRWNDITHQKMWVDWIRRAKDGGLRVMVALSHNNRTLAEAIGAGGPISGVKDDYASSNLQVEEIKAFVGRHQDLMKVALTALDLYQIVKDGKIAVLLGVEIDNIGNFNDVAGVTQQTVETEINRLYAQGVRYVFPVHLTDNLFGDTAIYSPMFNLANRRETGSFWTVGCAAPTDQVSFSSPSLPSVLNPLVPPGFPAPPAAPGCLTNGGTFFLGHVNARSANGLTGLGEFALKTMMKRGMIVDIDHMSDRSVERALQIAEAVQPGGGYPLVSGHGSIRDRNSQHYNAESSRSRTQLQRIGCLQGMFGLGTDGVEAYTWARNYLDAVTEMGKPTALCPDKSALGLGRVAFGSDTNSLVSGPRPTMVDVKPGTPPRFADIYNPNTLANDNPLLPVLPRSASGSKTWDYNFNGVAHFGMYADFVKDVRTAPVNPLMTKTGKDLVDNHLLKSADYFFRMWQKIESQKSNVQ